MSSGSSAVGAAVGLGARELDSAVDDDQRHVDAGGPQVAGHRLGQAALRRLRRGERGGERLAAQRGDGADHDDRSGLSLLHRSDHLLAQRNRPIVLIRQERSKPSASMSSMFPHTPNRRCRRGRRPRRGPSGPIRTRSRPLGIGDVACVGPSAELLGQLGRQVGLPRQHRDRVALGGELARERGGRSSVRFQPPHRRVCSWESCTPIAATHATGKTGGLVTGFASWKRGAASLF